MSGTEYWLLGVWVAFGGWLVFGLVGRAFEKKWSLVISKFFGWWLVSVLAIIALLLAARRLGNSGP